MLKLRYSAVATLLLVGTWTTLAGEPPDPPRGSNIFTILLHPAEAQRGSRPGYRAQGTLFGVPASYRALAGSGDVVPATGSTHGQGSFPKNDGLPVR